MASFALSVRMFTTKGGVQSIKYTYSVSHYYTRFIEIIENFQNFVCLFVCFKGRNDLCPNRIRILQEFKTKLKVCQIESFK